MCILSPICDALISYCQDPLDSQTTPTPMERVTKIFCTLFPLVGAGASALLFAATGHLVPFLGFIVFGTWSLISLITMCPDDMPRSTGTARKTNTIFSEQQTTVTINYHAPDEPYYQAPKNTYPPYTPPKTYFPNIFSPPVYTQAHQKRDPVGRITEVPSQSYTYETEETVTNPTQRDRIGRTSTTVYQQPPYTPPETFSNPTERDSVGRKHELTATRKEIEMPFSTQRDPVGRKSADDEPSIFYPSSSNPLARDAVGRKKSEEEGTEEPVMVGSVPTEREQIGRK